MQLKKKLNNFFYLFLVSLFFSNICLAKKKRSRKRPSSKTKVMSLSVLDAVRVYLKNNFNVKQVIAERAIAADEYRYQNLFEYIPSVSLFGSYSNSDTIDQKKYKVDNSWIKDDVDTKTRNIYQGSLGVNISNITLFNAWQRGDNISINDASFILAEIGANQQINTLIQNVVEQYMNLKVVKLKFKDAQRNLRVTKSLYGIINKGNQKYDETYLERAIAEAQSRLEEITGEYQATTFSFKELLQLDPKVTVSLTSELEINRPSFSKKYYKKRIKELPNYVTAKKSLELAELSLKSTKRTFFPSVNISLGTGLDLSSNFGKGTPTSTNIVRGGGSGNIDITTSINFSMPIAGPGGLFNSFALRRAKLSLIAARFEFNNQKKYLETSIETKLSELDAISNSLQSLEKTLLKTTQLQVYALKQYKDKKLNILDLKENLDNLVNDYLNVQDKKLELLRANRELVLITGKLSDLGIKEFKSFNMASEREKVLKAGF